MPEQQPFDPVMLDLTDDDDFATIVLALEDYESRMRAQADDDEEIERANPGVAADAARFRDVAERARRLVDEIQRQLDENAKIRNGRV